MQDKNNSIFLYLLADFVVLVFCIFGIYHIYLKADLPIKFDSDDSILIVKEVDQKDLNLSVGDTVLSIDNKHFNSQDEIEVFLDGFKEGSIVQIKYLKKGRVFSIYPKLEKFYSAFYLITACISGLLLILIGTFVLWKKFDNKPAKLLYWVNLFTAAVIMMTWGNYSNPLTIYDYFLHIIFSISYSLAPALFVHFTLSFPREKNVHRVVIVLLYSSAFFISLFSSIFFLKALSSSSVPDIQKYLVVFNYSRIYMAACIISGLVIFIHTYVTSKSYSERIKLRWVLLGFILGPLMFACLWVIPQAITNYGLVPEEFVLIFMLFIPVTFAIAILKHHIFDIDLIIERSLIYFLSVSILILVYTAIISILTEFIKNINEYFSAGVAAVIIALLFHPAKDRVQKIIDKKFFRVKYNFRIASRIFLDEINNCNDINSLANKIVEQNDAIIPVDRTGFFLFDPFTSRLRLAAHRNFDFLEHRGVFLDRKKLKTALQQPVALKDKVEPGIPIEVGDNNVFRRWGMALVFPIHSTNKELLGFFVLGEKKSETRFTVEDIDLLIEITSQAGVNLERIKLQENLIREQLLKEKLEELNKLKSFFISSVSHELKTPLTSIRMFAEMLQLKENLKSDQANEYLEIIEGECDRLGRLIENVLDLSKIERGVKEFHFTEINLKSLLNHAVKLMTYQLKIEKCAIEISLCDDECIICGDSDSILGAVINLLSNGIKYSAVPKKILVSMDKNDNAINVNFENKGSCFGEDEITKLTEPYFRTESTKNKNIPGSGIGLTLVKQIISIHKGKFIVKNIPHSGCRFILSFPLEVKIEKDINN